LLCSVNASTPDPTNGLVQYLGRTAATAQNITYVDSAGLFNMRVDTTEVQLSGRPSARITSQKTFEDGIFVINVTHVPTGCSVWPAFWLVAPDTKAYPLGGEIDILENANDQFAGTLTSLHTANNCVIDKSKQMQTGVTSYTNCTVDYT
jgi:beta-glucanase (GH16 family)